MSKYYDDPNNLEHRIVKLKQYLEEGRLHLEGFKELLFRHKQLVGGPHLYCCLEYQKLDNEIKIRIYPTFERAYRNSLELHVKIRLLPVGCTHALRAAGVEIRHNMDTVKELTPIPEPLPMYDVEEKVEPVLSEPKDLNKAMLDRDLGVVSYAYIKQCQEVKYGYKNIQKKEIQVHQVKNVYVVNNQLLSWHKS